MTFANGLLIVTETSGVPVSASYRKDRKQMVERAVQFAFHHCSFNSLGEEQLEPIPQITCSLIQASRCSIDTVVRMLDPNALIIICKGRGRQGDHTAPQWTVHHMDFPVSHPTTHIYIIYITLRCVVLPGVQKKKNTTSVLTWLLPQDRPHPDCEQRTRFGCTLVCFTDASQLCSHLLC